MEVQLLEFIEETNKAENQNKVFELFLKSLENIGYDRVVYSYMTDSPNSKKKAQHGVARNYPEYWMKYYAENNYVNKDPVYLLALRKRTPFIWSDLEKKVSLSKVQKKVMDESREAKLLDGMALSIRGEMDEIIGIGLASSTGGIHPDKNMLSSIYALTHQFHFAHSGFEEEFPKTLVTLTEKEREVLLWASQGKGNTVIGEIMMISDHCVDYHLRNIFSKLDVPNKTVAVLKAHKLGLIRI